MSTVQEKGQGSRSSNRLTKKKKKSGPEIHPPEGEGGLVDRPNLPLRIFATNRYPPDGRINSYSKPEYLLDLIHALEGTPEFEKLMESPFGCLFQLPVRKCSLSGKLVHNILCRGLVTEKEHEIWYVFGGYPIRFSLREFAILTGLRCGPFPSVDDITAMQTPPEGQNRYWDTLICSNNAVTVQEIVNMLKRDSRKPVGKKMPGWRRFRLALIVIVEGILICGSQPVRVSLEVVEMVRNLDAFMGYPWGRESFEMTLRMIKVGSKVENLGTLLDKFLQSHTLCHGFPIAIQLHIFRSIPLLEQYLPNCDDETFAESDKVQLSKLKSYHNTNILQSEYDPSVKVESILQTDDPFDESSVFWETNGEDTGVDYIERLIDQGHQFSIDEWHGGHTGCALMIPPPPKRGVGTLKPCKGKKHDKNPPRDDDDDDLLYQLEVINYAHSMELQKAWDSQRSVLKAELKREILQELRAGEHVLEMVDDGNRNLSPVDNSNVPVDKSLGDKDTKVPHHEMSPTNGDFPVDKTSGDKNTNVPQHDPAIDHQSPTGKITGVIESMKSLGILNYCSSDKAESQERGTRDDQSDDVDENEDHDSVLESSDKDDDVVDKEGQKKEESDDDDSTTKGEDEVRGTGNEDHDSVLESSDKDDHVVDKEGQKKEESDDDDSTTKGEDEERGTGNEVCDDVDEQDKGTDGSDVDGQALSHGQELTRVPKRPREPIKSESSIPDPARPKRPRVVPSRFRSPPSMKAKNALVCIIPDSAVYTPFGGVDGQKQKKFMSILAATRNREFVIDGHGVKKEFFKGILTPRNWVDTIQMEAMLSLVWRKQGDDLLQARIGVIDTWFTKMLATEYRDFKKKKGGNPFPWNSLIKNTVRGVLPTRASKMMWYRDVDLVYAPMNWGKGHWVALAIELKLGKIHILDPLINVTGVKKMNTAMKPIVEMLPVVIRDILSLEAIDFTLPEAFQIERVVNVSQNERTGDCGPLAVKFIELDAQGFDLDDIDDAMVDQLRMKYAVDIYEEFVHFINI